MLILRSARLSRNNRPRASGTAVTLRRLSEQARSNLTLYRDRDGARCWRASARTMRRTTMMTRSAPSPVYPRFRRERTGRTPPPTAPSVRATAFWTACATPFGRRTPRRRVLRAPIRLRRGATPRTREIGRVRCAFPGCEKRWDRFRYGDIKNWYRKHYCCSCQLFYCHRHTRVSSHSPRVTCDIGSNCYCEMCYDSLNPQAALKLEKSNHFDKKFMRNVKASLLSRSSNTSSPGASGSS